MNTCSNIEPNVEIGCNPLVGHNKRKVIIVVGHCHHGSTEVAQALIEAEKKGIEVIQIAKNEAEHLI